MNREKVTELLKNYPSYRYAVRMYESKRIIAAPVAVYDDMPKAGGYGSRMPPMNDGITLEDISDYLAYKSAVEAIDGALATLYDDEREVVMMKWMRGLTLEVIERQKHYGIGYARQVHRKALQKLAVCLQFVDVPEIQTIGITYKQTVNI